MSLTSPYDWLRYSNAEKIRDQPLSDNLLNAFNQYVPDLGLQIEVFSGGQPSNKPGEGTGSTRHNHGNAADVYLYRSGVEMTPENRLVSTNPEDRALMAQFITQSRANGLAGIGFGEDYMGPSGIHVGYGNPAFWSSTQSGRPKVPWAYEAYLAGVPELPPDLGTPRPGGGFRAALTTSESSNNPNAYNNEVGAGGHRGHGGLLQFGTARLADAARAGVIPRMTAAEFAQQPVEIQNRVGDWHFQDIDRQIERFGLDQYYGQTIGGALIDHSAVTAMAHLGGVGGAKRFLESNGAYNPADAYGTRLSDYAQRFSGMDNEEERGRPGVEGPAASLDFDSVLSSDYLRRNSDPNGIENTTLSYSSALMERLDRAVRRQEDLLGYAAATRALTFGALMPDIKDTPEYQTIFPPNAPLPTNAASDYRLPGGEGDDRLRSPVPLELLRRNNPRLTGPAGSSGELHPFARNVGDPRHFDGGMIEQFITTQPVLRGPAGRNYPPGVDSDPRQEEQRRTGSTASRTGRYGDPRQEEQRRTGSTASREGSYGDPRQEEQRRTGTGQYSRNAPTPEEVAAAAANGEWSLGEPVTQSGSNPVDWLGLEQQAQAAASQVRAAMPENIPAPEERERGDWAGFLQALGVGIGQLAAGQPIDITGVMGKRLEAQREQEQAELEAARLQAEAEREQRQWLIEQDRAERRLALDAMRFELNERKFDYEVEQDTVEGRPNQVDFTAFEPVLATMPEPLQDVITAAQVAQTRGDYATRDMLLDVVDRNMDGIYEFAENSAVMGEGFDNRMQLLSQAATSDPETANQLYTQALEGATVEERELLDKAYNNMKSPANLTEVEAAVEDYKREFPDATPAEIRGYREHLIRLKSGVQTPEMLQAQMDNDARIAGMEQNIQYVQEYDQNVRAAGRAASDAGVYIDQGIRAIDEILAEGSETSGLTGVVNSIAKATDTVIQGFLEPGQAGVGDWLVDNGYIVDTNAWEQLDGSARMLGLLMARGLMEGQGSVTDEERRSLMNALVSGNQDEETVKAMLARLKTLNEIDKIAYNIWDAQYNSNYSSVDDITKARNLSARLDRLVDVAKTEVVPSSIQAASFQLSMSSEVERYKAAVEAGDEAAIQASVSNLRAAGRQLIYAAPILTTDEAKVLYSALPINQARAEYRGAPTNKVFINRELIERGVPIEEAIYIVTPDRETDIIEWESLFSGLDSGEDENATPTVEETESLSGTIQEPQEVVEDRIDPDVDPLTSFISNLLR